MLLGQEINAELGSMSESSDDEFLTTRVVRRRVVIQVSAPVWVVDFGFQSAALSSPGVLSQVTTVQQP